MLTDADLADISAWLDQEVIRRDAAIAAALDHDRAVWREQLAVMDDAVLVEEVRRRGLWPEGEGDCEDVVLKFSPRGSFAVEIVPVRPGRR